MSLRLLPADGAVWAWTAVGAEANGAISKRPHQDRRRSSRTADYCGLGSMFLQLCVACAPHDQSPHLSQPASSAPSTIMQAMRAARLRQSAAGLARMENPRSSRPREGYSTFPNGFAAEVRPFPTRLSPGGGTP